jgi:hypothetical protein
MSQVTHPRIPLTEQVRSHRIVALAGLLAFAATVAVVLVLAIGGDSSGTQEPAAQQAQPSVRADGGPEESSVAASVGGADTQSSQRPDGGPEESTTALSIGRSDR